MNDREESIVVVLHEDPVADARKVLTRIGGEKQSSGRFSASFTFSVPHEVSIAVDPGYSRDGAVRPQKFVALLLKPIVVAEFDQFHRESLSSKIMEKHENAEPTPRSPLAFGQEDDIL